MSLPIDPSFSTAGPEWGIGSVGGATETAPTGGGFGGMLGKQLAQLSETQTVASQQARSLAVGEAQDPTEVVMAVERARLEMQVATTLRNKGVEVVQELMRTQV